MKKILGFLTILVGVSLLAPAMSFAETGTTTSTTAQLQQRLIDLQTQIDALLKQKQEVTTALVRTLGIGSQGDDVKTLQILLASDPTLYPEGKVSGYFGQLTSKAVKKFQKKYGIEQVGSIGPKTLRKLNEILNGSSIVMQNGTFATSTQGTTTPPWNMGTSTSDCLVVPPGHLIAKGFLKKMGDDEQENDGNDNEGDHGKGSKGRGHKDNDGWSNSEKEREGRPFSVPCNFLPYGIWKKIDHGTTTPPVPPTPDTTAPVISNITTSGITTTSALVSWTTNEAAYGQFAYGTTTDYSTTTSWSGTTATGYSQAVTGLTASTIYHFQIRAKDAAGNTATSTDLTLTTSAAPDITPPVISSLGSGSIASTTAAINWTTDEPATSKVYYGTTTPLNLLGASFIADSSLVTSHSKTLSSLTASTTHYYIAVSSDAAGNTATSTESSFTTLP